MLNVENISALVDQELSSIVDAELVAAIRALLVTPTPVGREWDYGRPGETLTCWTVLEHRPSNTGIAYCAQGFGSSDPWGIVFLSGDYTGVGMDAAWFPTLEAAMRVCPAWDSGKNPEGYESP